MCTPSKRERRFGPLKTSNKLMVFLRLCSNMSMSRKLNEHLERINSEIQKFQNTNEQSTLHVRDDQTRLKMRTRQEDVSMLNVHTSHAKSPFSPRVRIAIFLRKSEGVEAKWRSRRGDVRILK
jgi:hypothetical protein